MSVAYKKFCDFVYRHSGLVLGDGKEYLVESKMRPIMAAQGFTDLGQIVNAIEERSGSDLAREVVETMTINETYFFRDKHPFDAFSEAVIPELIARRSNTQPIRIWSAACSTGQEPYSLAILLEELRSIIGSRPYTIIATDLSRAVLERAKEGIYTQFEVQRGMRTNFLLKYFEQMGDRWRIKPQLKTHIEFRELNLMSPSFGLPKFDVIFCRNVLIYFDPPTKLNIMRRLRSTLADDGFLVLGASETVVGSDLGFRADEQRRCLLRADGEISASSFVRTTGEPKRQFERKAVSAEPSPRAQRITSGLASPGATTSEASRTESVPSGRLRALLNSR